jgi:hypothetical protein
MCYLVVNVFMQTVQFIIPLNIIYHIYIHVGTADGGTVVKVLCYKSEGRWLDFRWCHWNFSLT